MIRIYNENEIEMMRRGGKILAEIMSKLKKEVRLGITTEYLNRVAKDLVLAYGAEPSFLGFQDYPAVLCTSTNEEIVHAVPSERELKEGDILSLDLGIRFEDYYTDVAITVLVKGNKKIYPPKFFEEEFRRVKKLIAVTEKSFEIGIKQAKAGNHLEDISWAIQNYAEKNGFNVIRELVGHGVGKKVHEEPQIPNYGEREKGTKLKEGMVLAIEPMLCIGDWHIKKCEDGFGYKTADNSLSAHFEHTIAITKNGPIILTK